MKRNSKTVMGDPSEQTATCDYDIENDGLVTDFVQELSSGLEIPFLLSDSVSNVHKQSEVNSLENNFYEISTNDHKWMDDDIYINTSNYNCSNELDLIKDEVDDDVQSYLVRNEIVQTHSKCDSSGSGSECSSSEIWPTKNELDTPPVTPPEERISPDVFVFSPNQLKFIPLSQDDVKLLKGDKNKQNFYSTSKKVRIQPKPNPATFGIFDKQHVDPTFVCNVFKEVQSSPTTCEESNDYFKAISASGLRKTVLSREDLERLQAKRKQERMIRNRESAYLSRKRKKEYVTHLEKQVQDLTTENSQLRLENYNLRERLTKYEELIPLSMNGKSRNVFTESPRKTTALLALMLTICLNIGSFSNLMNEGGQGRESEDSVAEKVIPFHAHGVRHARSLLWTDPQLEDIQSTLSNITKTSCPMFINQTESIRLESELRRWIRGDEDFSRPTKRNISKINQYFDGDIKPQRHRKSPKRKLRQRMKKTFSQTNEIGVDMFTIKPHLFNFETFFEAIHRRDDTFYLVSFSGDHLLLPALAHNKTSRPKMSLMLPAFLSNTTSGVSSDQVEMMQIDCEVTNTKLMSVNENDIPSHMRPYSNATSRQKDPASEDTPAIEEYFMDDISDGLLSNGRSKNANRLRTVPKSERTVKTVVNISKSRQGSANETDLEIIPPQENYFNVSNAEKEIDNFKDSAVDTAYFTYGKMSEGLNKTLAEEKDTVQYLYTNGRSMLKSLIMPQNRNLEPSAKKSKRTTNLLP